MALSTRFWERRCKRLFAKADAIKDSEQNNYSFMPLKKFYKMNILYQEASTISMMLDTIYNYNGEENTKEKKG